MQLVPSGSPWRLRHEEWTRSVRILRHSDRCSWLDSGSAAGQFQKGLVIIPRHSMYGILTYIGVVVVGGQWGGSPMAVPSVASGIDSIWTSTVDDELLLRGPGGSLKSLHRCARAADRSPGFTSVGPSWSDRNSSKVPRAWDWKSYLHWCLQWALPNSSRSHG